MFRQLLNLVCLLALAGCDGKDDDNDDSGTAEHDGHDGGDGGDGGDAHGTATDGGTWMVSYETGTEEIPLSEEFSLTITVMGAETDAPATDVEVTATAEMPAHGHGLNQEPTVTSNGDGTFQVDGLLFHMEGDWELVIGVSDGSTSEVARIGISCCS